MERFINETTLGNEHAIKKGTRVPDGAVNLAWVKAPRLTPDKNVVIIDTSRMVAENASDDDRRCKIMYANDLGILEDAYGNQLIDDEYPSVADTFSIDEDFIAVPGSEYRAEHILPYLHTSRYFHVDFPGLTLGTIPQTFRSDILRIVDENGKDYVDDKGEPRYRIQITPANVNLSQDEESTAYRVFAFVDTIENENLYLTYNKIEVTAEGQLTNQNINHREIINPQPYFTYKPEESDVTDASNRHKKWYSTKPATLKQQVLGQSYADVDGYKVYVPKKAIGDPRLFQLFRWRVSCDFVEQYKIDPIKDAASIKAGVLITNTIQQSASPFIFYNMENSEYNATNVSFVNPLKTVQDGDEVGESAKQTQDYWEVNLDTVTNEELKKFDILVFNLNTPSFNFSAYLPKIRYFTETLGKTLIIDTSSYTVPTNLGPTFSPGTTSTGAQRTPGTFSTAEGTTIQAASTSHILFDANAQLGGWSFNDGSNDEYASISPYKNGGYSGSKLQYMLTKPNDYETVIQAVKNGTTTTYPVVVRKAYASGGNIVISTMGLVAAVNKIFSPISGFIVYNNMGAEIVDTDIYNEAINSFAVEGAFKLFFNLNLLAVKGAILDSSDEERYSSAWTFSSPWKASWVIDGTRLTESERDESDFVFMPKDPSEPIPVWQRKLTNKSYRQLIDESLSTEDLRRVSGATRTYRLEITNGLVEGPSTIIPETKPHAWTEAYSPPFEVPVELGPYVIKNDPVQGEYNAGQYDHKNYPSKPYSVKTFFGYNSTAQSMLTEEVTVTATGRATAVTKSVTPVTSANTELSWRTHGSNIAVQSGVIFEFHAPVATGARSWQQSNYYTNYWGPGNRIWPHYGLYGRWAIGSRGEVVAFIQEAMNRFMWWGFFNGGIGGGLSVDGYYGSKTYTVVRNFQATFGARYVDGVVDAETLSLIGAQILRLGYLVGTINPNDHTRFFGWPAGRISTLNISDKSPHNSYEKRSWISGGPSIIWELIAIRFNNVYNIHGISLTPKVEGATRNLMWRSIDVRTTASTGAMDQLLVNYNSQWGRLIYMPHRPSDGQKYYIPFGPYSGNTIIVGIGQDRGTGYGSSRMLGVRDIVAHAMTQAGGETIYKETSINISYSKTVNVTTGKVVNVQAYPNYTGSGTLKNIVWESVSVDNPDVAATISSSGKISLEHNQVANYQGSDFTAGPAVPSEVTGIRSMNENKVLNPGTESGWITKTDGIKLLCDANKKPVGFPPFPTGIGPYEAQRHYGSMTIARTGTDPSVVVGFYDVAHQEFILNEQGEAEITYIEYLRRGPQNIYIGLLSTYEEVVTKKLPEADDAPPLPFKWAMPVYGICSKSGSRIGIEPLPAGLGATDLWYVPIRTGKFNRVLDIRSNSEGPLTGWVSDYQGTRIRAFYSVPEAENGGYSDIYGRPNFDVEGENPLIVDDNIIQVKQAPILMVKEPTILPTEADPVRPVFKVWIRDSVNDPWTEMPKSEILDYNVSDGTIVLRNPLDSADSNLVKVDYTTSRKIYKFKQYDGDKINLNPYPGHSRDLIGKPIFVYIVPEFAKDRDGKVIADSVEDTTVRFTLDPSLFDQLSPDYNPLAIQLGVIYITTALDIKDLTILDTRRRGGGAKDSATAEEVKRITQEAMGYWDIGFGAGLSYQKGGFVIIRLPEELKDQFPNEEEILTTIRRNLTSGVQFKLEDLVGNDWS